jgi:hypothetical protein
MSDELNLGESFLEATKRRWIANIRDRSEFSLYK